MRLARVRKQLEPIPDDAEDLLEKIRHLRTNAGIAHGREGDGGPHEEVYFDCAILFDALRNVVPET